MSLPSETIKGMCAVVKRDLEPLMRMLGVKEVYTVESWDEARRTLSELMNRGDVAVVLVQEGLVPREVSFIDLNSQRRYPIITMIPDTREKLSENPSAYYRELIRRYIGYEVHVG